MHLGPSDSPFSMPSGQFQMYLQPSGSETNLQGRRSNFPKAILDPVDEEESPEASKMASKSENMFSPLTQANYSKISGNKDTSPFSMLSVQDIKNPSNPVLLSMADPSFVARQSTG